MTQKIPDLLSSSLIGFKKLYQDVDVDVNGNVEAALHCAVTLFKQEDDLGNGSG